MKELVKDVKMELKPASAGGYTFTQEEKNIIQQDNTRRIVLIMLNNSSLNPNLKSMPELCIRDNEYEEIAYKTVGRVIERLGQELEK